MNHYIEIYYKPDWSSNYWSIWFRLNNKEYREKAPSGLDSRGIWGWWCIHSQSQKGGFDFDWNES